MKRKLVYALFAAAVCPGLGLAYAHADTINLTLTSSNATGTPGSTVTYSATLSAPITNTGLVYLNNDTISLNNPAGVTTDGTDLFFNFDEDLAPGQTESGALFTVTLPSAALGGLYGGDFILQGGANLSAQDTLDTTPFTLSVPSAASVTPEPASWLLLSTGVLLVVGVSRRRWAYHPEGFRLR